MDNEKDMTLAEEEEGGKEAEHEKTFCDSLTASVHAETADSGKYDELAKQAEEEYPDRGYGYILRCIAAEEQKHLEFLQKILFDIKASAK